MQPPPDPMVELELWKIEVESIYERSWDAWKVGAEFARMALQSSFVINGGALALLPALITWLPPADRSAASAEAVTFVIGLLLAAGSTLCAYFHFFKLGLLFHLRATLRALSRRALKGPLDAAEASELAEGTQNEPFEERVSNFFSACAVVTGLFSFIFFGVGAFTLANLAR